MAVLGIDIGTGGSRAVAIDADGRILASASEAHADFASPHAGWAEQDPADWWRACRKAIGEVVARIGADAITAVSFSGQMHGSVLLDAAGSVVRPALLWCDQRTAAQCDLITARFGREQLIAAVANPAITGFTLPKLLWVREHEPSAWERVAAVLLPKDYIRYRLSGDLATDVADASGTLLLDVANRRWSGEVLAAFDLDRGLMPELFESTAVTGSVSDAGAAETGLRKGTPIVAGAGDNAAGAIGMGIVRPGMVSATIGTSGVVFAVSDAPRIDPEGRIHTLCHAIPGRWHNTGVTLAAGLSLKWFRENFGCGESYDELVSEAAAVPAGSDGVVWLPYLMGERTPHLDADARAVFLGIAASHGRGHLTRAVLEGVAFSLREALEIFGGAGVRISTVRLGGGGAKSAVWRQIQADVYGTPVETIAADEGAAFGAAILAGVGTSVWESVDEACDATIRVEDRIEPDAAAKPALDTNFEVYKAAYRALRRI